MGHGIEGGGGAGDLLDGVGGLVGERGLPLREQEREQGLGHVEDHGVDGHVRQVVADEVDVVGDERGHGERPRGPERQQRQQLAPAGGDRDVGRGPRDGDARRHHVHVELDGHEERVDGGDGGERVLHGFVGLARACAHVVQELVELEGEAGAGGRDGGEVELGEPGGLGVGVGVGVGDVFVVVAAVGRDIAVAVAVHGDIRAALGIPGRAGPGNRAQLTALHVVAGFAGGRGLVVRSELWELLQVQRRLERAEMRVDRVCDLGLGRRVRHVHVELVCEVQQLYFLPLFERHVRMEGQLECSRIGVLERLSLGVFQSVRFRVQSVRVVRVVRVVKCLRVFTACSMCSVQSVVFPVVASCCWCLHRGRSQPAAKRPEYEAQKPLGQRGRWRWGEKGEKGKQSGGRVRERTQ